MKWEHRDIRIAYHERGLAGVRLLIENGATPSSAKKALAALEAMGVDASDLRTYLDDSGILDGRAKQAKPGERRRYKWSKIRNRKCILLPVDVVLGLAEGDDVEAHFDDGKIVITKGASDDQ